MERNLSETLVQSINSANEVFIIGHNRPDLDAIASAMGIARLCNELGKQSHIIIDEEDSLLEPGVRKVKQKSEDHYDFINVEDYLSMKGENNLLVLTDVNKEYMIAVKDYLDDFKDIVIIDHHAGDDYTVKTEKVFIDEQTSSASEMVTTMLEELVVDYDEELANSLLAGIYLDTNKLNKANAQAKTFMMVARLLSRGANQVIITEELLSNSFLINKAIHHLTDNCTTLRLFSTQEGETQSVSISTGENDVLYEAETLAKAADNLIRENPLDASFVLGFTAEGMVSISARGKGDINVGDIMETLGGGGNARNAGAQIQSNSIEPVVAKLSQAIEEFRINSLALNQYNRVQEISNKDIISFGEQKIVSEYYSNLRRATEQKKTNEITDIIESEELKNRSR